MKKIFDLGGVGPRLHNSVMTTAQVVHHLRRRLERLLRTRSRSREDAEDVIQDAFLRLQVYYNKGGDVREPEAFLVKTAIRLAINSSRDAGRRARAEELITTQPLIETTPLPEEVVDAEERLGALQRRLKSLHPQTRDVFLLHRVDGLSYAQIAKLYGLTGKAVERRIARAMLAVSQEDGIPADRSSE